MLGLFNRYKKLTEEQLVVDYKTTTNMSSVGELFQRYTHLVATIAMGYLKNKEETEDAVMEVFEIVVEDLKKHDVVNFKAWLYSVTKNHCLKKKRQLSKHKSSDEIETIQPSFEDEKGEFEKLLFKEKQLNSLEGALKKLKPEQEECLRLFYLKKMSYKDIVIQTGYTDKQVKSFIQNGKRKLKLDLSNLN